MTGDGLRFTLERCREEGLKPYYLTATLGTTATCAADKFGEIADVLIKYPNIRTHVDAAYAGGARGALACEEYHYPTEHFEKFNSFDLNLSKVAFDKS
ncbi:hypothetical protein MMC12_006933 [Toensbergia leucococca]|nr:hypothetical protein [Toensbergia leucococca]